MYSNPDCEDVVREAWKRYLQGKPSAQALRSMINVSWHRSAQAQVSPYQKSGPEPMSQGALEARIDLQHDLMEASWPVLEHAKDLFQKTGLIVALVDTDGAILSAKGDHSTLDSAHQIHLIPGSIWNEEHCGTNAIGTALHMQAPVQVHSTEHFCEGIQHWTCSATVIRHPGDGRVIGAIDVSGLSHNYSRQNLALAILSASRIESHLSKLEAKQRYRLVRHTTGYLSRIVNDGVVVFDRNGCPIQYNQQAQRIIAAISPNLDITRARSFPQLALQPAKQRADAVGLPDWVQAEWLDPIIEKGECIGTLMVLPNRLAPKSTVYSNPPACSSQLPMLSDASRDKSFSFAGIITDDAGMQALIKKATSLRTSNIPVLVLGETGVGKEEFVRGLHRDGPFVAINCGGLTRELLASELFGYAEGAFTGARKGGMQGKIEAAHNGTLFLDEIGEMPLDMQANLLRVLEQREIYRIGETAPRLVNFRLVAATHRDLSQEIRAGRFRMDLYYRIAVATLEIPALRDRGRDILLLARHFWCHFRQSQGGFAGSLAPDTEHALESYHWPGNVRELRNAIESSLLQNPGAILQLHALPSYILSRKTAHEEPSTLSAPLAIGQEVEGRPSGSTLAQREEESIRQALKHCKGNKTQAAKRLNIAKSTLYSKLSRYGITG